MTRRFRWTLGAILAAAACRAPGTRTPTPAAAATGTRATRLRVIATNDFHGALEARPDDAGVMHGGAAALATMIAKARRECVAPGCESILLDGGDMFQGTPASNFAFGRPVIDVYDALDYSASALGNHEFDWGLDTLRAIMRAAHYRILGANVRYTDGRDVEWIPDDTLVVRGGVRVGVIGIATTETPQVTRPATIPGLRFDDPAPIVDSLARRLRARGADAVIVVAHAGAFCRRAASPPCSGEIITLANRLTAKVDAIVSGHTHTLVDTQVNGIPVVQARSSGTALDVVDVPVGAGTGPPVRQIREVLTQAVAPDARIAAIVSNAVGAVAARTGRVEATLTSSLTERQAGDLIADATRFAAHADLAFMNDGGVRAPLHAGRVTYGDLLEVQPFGNLIYRETVRGRDLRAYLERRVRGRTPDATMSGATVTYDPTRPPGARVLDVRFTDGSSLVDDRLYTVALNDFMVTNESYGFGTAAVGWESINAVDIDCLIAYLRSLPQPVPPPAGPRFVARPGPARSQGGR